jgi:cysteine-rich repeat protein
MGGGEGVAEVNETGGIDALTAMGGLDGSARVDNRANIGGQGGGGNGNGGGSNGGSGGCGILCTSASTGSRDATAPLPPLKNCGNGVLDSGEQCDDGNTKNGDGCNAICQIEANWLCPTPGQPCVDRRKCGNGVLTSDETCDDNNTKDGDGCSGDCTTIEDGFECRLPGKPCTPICGDSKKKGSEACDDGNTTDGDGCSSTCQIEPGSSCPDGPGACTKAICGNGVKEKNEQCDCGIDPANLPAGCKGQNGAFYGDGTGCSKTCTKEPNCSGSSGTNQACARSCGDGSIDPGEDCDDGNQLSGDGCSSSCKVEDGFGCILTKQPDSSNLSKCTTRCGDGIVSAGEECDCGDPNDPSVQIPAGCPGKNANTLYGGCKTNCKWGPFCGDGNSDSPDEQCDYGKDNGHNLGQGGCTFGCMTPHYCGDGIVDTDQGEQCDMGVLNGVPLDVAGNPTDAGNTIECTTDCMIGTALR